MKIAFTAQGRDLDAAMDPRFGRTPFFVVVDEETGNVEAIDNSDAGQQAHGAGPKTAQKLSEIGASVLITGNGPGGNAGTVLQSLGVEVYVGAGEMSVKDAMQAYKDGTLRKL